MPVIAVVVVVILTVTAPRVVAAAVIVAPDDGGDGDYEFYDVVAARITGIARVLVANPGMCGEALVRIGLAVGLETVLDGLLEGVVVPSLERVTPRRFGGWVGPPAAHFLGEALRPVLRSVSFLFFDDRFLDTVLESTGTKEALAASLCLTTGWHETQPGLFRKLVARYCLKAVASWFVGFAGLLTVVPLVGPVLTAFLSGWIVAWDCVCVPLWGMGRTTAWSQLETVLADLPRYHRFGVGAVLLEEMMIIPNRAGAAMHVYNVYSAAFFLKDLYGGHRSPAPPACATTINATGMVVATVASAAAAAATNGHAELG